MLTGTVWGVTLLIAGLAAAIAASGVLLAALFPRAARRSRDALAARPVVCAAAGLVLAVVFTAVAAGIGKVWQFGGALAAAAALLPVMLGLGAVAAEVGARLPSQGAAGSDWRAQIRGSVTLSLASLLPVAGWFGVFPLSIATGVGAWSLGLFGVGAAKPARVPSTPVPVTPPAPEPAA